MAGRAAISTIALLEMPGTRYNIAIMNSTLSQKSSGTLILGKALKIVAMVVWGLAALVFVATAVALTYHTPWLMAHVPRNTPRNPWLVKEIGIFWAIVGIAFGVYTAGDRLLKRANPEE